MAIRGIEKVNLCEKNVKPGKWDMRKADEYTQNINHDYVLSVIENADHKIVNEITNELKKILLDTALKTFPPKSKKFTKKFNSRTMLAYDKQCYVSRQGYHKAKHKNNISETEISYNDMIRKSKKYKQKKNKISSQS